MTEKELLEEYPILKDKMFELTKRSIISLMDEDNLEEDRAFMFDLFDSWSDDDGDDFYYEMLRCVKFILEDATAYTTPDRIIALNYPMDMVPQDENRYKRWYFVYCHECLHQLWDTFAVAKEIEAKLGSCNRKLLNIASDCVINDFLSTIAKSHKMPPVGGIFPNVIKEKFGIEYNNKYDTQYSLYMKMIELNKNQQEQLEDMDEEFEGKIKPKKVNKQDGPGPTPPPPPGGKVSDEFKKGWTDAIKDVLDKKVDPLKAKPKEEKGDYEKGYNTAIETIKKGLEQGITISKGGGGKGPSNGLPPIPWDIDNKEKTSNPTPKKNNDSDKSKEAAEKAKEAAEKAQKAADKAKEAAEKGDKEGAKKALEEAKKAAEEAKNATEEMEGSGSGNESESDKKDDSEGKSAKDLAKEAQEAADKAKEAAEKAQQAAKKGQQESNDKSDNDSHDAGDGDGNIDDKELIEETKRHAEAVCKKFANSISGPLKTFIEKCNAAKKLKKNGLLMDATKGDASWDKELLAECKHYVKQKLRNKKEYKTVYTRIRRGEKAFSRADLQNGRLIMPGKEEQKNKMGFDINLYIDTSGSMSGCIDKVFTTAYSIVDQLKKTFSKEKNVDKNKIELNSFIFTTRMRKIKYGEKARADGGTYAFDELLSDINKAGNAAFLNIIITDGDFSGINNQKVAEVINGMKGMFAMVTNKSKGTYDRLEKDVVNKCGPKFKAIYADADFKIK